MPTLNDLRPEYERLFNSCEIKPSKFAEIDAIANGIIAHQTRYEGIGKPLNIPWYFIGITHHMECGLSFKKHLHNGDPLTAKTKQVPKGRPLGTPPFTFEQSAKDALLLQKLDKVTDWSIPGVLFVFEKFNGFGYRKKTINMPSPYLWSYSNHYTKGKFSADGLYDPKLVSKQAGTASILRRLTEKQAIDFKDQRIDRIKAIKQLGERVRFNPNDKIADALRLQELLNEVGFPLLRDGKAGEKTSNAYKQASGKFLPGDPRRK